ncbi:MAG: lysoplasmalogenase [Melioribacteraceae bacterium]
MSILKKTDLLDKVFYISFFMFFILYVGTLKIRPYPLQYLTKILPLLVLIIIAYRGLHGNKRNLILLGLFISLIGDILLDLHGKNLFLLGIISFGIAHFMYILALYRNPTIRNKRIWLLPFLLAYGVGLWNILAPELGEMLIPATIYLILITSMGISAILGKNNHFLIIIGAIFFIFSDSVIAINVFLTKISNSSYFIMLSYYPAQFLITYGTILSKNIVKDTHRPNN